MPAPKTLKYRILLGVIILVLTSGLTVAWLAAYHYSQSLHENMKSQAITVAQNLAMQAADKVLINDLVGIQRMLENRKRSDQSVGYLLLVRGDRVLGHTFEDGVPQGLLVGLDKVKEFGSVTLIEATSGERYLDVAWPIMHGEAGVVRLGLKESPYSEKMKAFWGQITLVTLLVLGVAAFLCLLFARSIARPLENLSRTVQEFGNGDRKIRIKELEGPLEVLALSRSFNNMVDEVEDYTRRLEQRSADLERAQQQTQVSCKIMQEVGALATPVEIGRLLTARLKAILPCNEVVLAALYEAEGQALVFRDDAKLEISAPSESQALKDLLGGLKEKREFQLADLPRFLATPAMSVSKRLTMVPLHGEGETFAALAVTCHENKQCESCELRVAELIADQASGALLRALRNEEEMRLLADQTAYDHGFRGMVGKDSRMQTVYKLIQDVAPTDSTVLILGESGTGKELVARAIHDISHRKERPFVVIDCSSYPATLLESELFGHEKGAFTGAIRRKAGRFEMADGGTIFLDEVGEIPLSAQSKLLRVIQTHRFERIGGEETLDLDVRILAATNKDLVSEVKAGNFREDLYYRLYVFPLEMPPLRERRNDIPRLARHFLARFIKEQGRQISDFSPAAMKQLLDYDWPGNVRELENLVERSVVLAKGEVVEAWDLPPDLRQSETSMARPLDYHEKTILVEALAQNDWNKKAAAQSLGISRTTLYRKIRKYGLDEPTRH